MVGSKIIDWAMRGITKGELAKVTMTWKQAHFRDVMSRSLQLPHTGSNRTGVKKGMIHPPGAQHHGGEGILPGQCLRPSPHHTEGHYSPIWYSQCTLQYQCQGTLYVGPHACRANVRPSVAYSSGANCNLQGVTSGVLSGTHLSAQIKCSFYQNPHEDSGWPGHACQPSTTGGPPTGFWGVNQQPQKGWILEALDLQGLGEWPAPEQDQVQELLLKWEHIFAHSNLDLGRNALIKHRIEVADQMPFKEYY